MTTEFMVGSESVSRGGFEPLPVPVWKRGLDIVCIMVGLPFVIIPMGVVALLIRLVSRGPILFRQERIGYLGRPFNCFKFRTMHIGAETAVHSRHFSELIESDKPMVKIDGADRRIIPFGRILRATGLDELPQLINVLRGDMSLVGPRPCIRYEFDQYLPWQRERFNTLPGLTGLWQVSGKNRTTFSEMIRLDIEYARTKTLVGDLTILIRTVPAILTQVCDMRRRREQASASAHRRVEDRTGNSIGVRLTTVGAEVSNSE